MDRVESLRMYSLLLVLLLGAVTAIPARPETPCAGTPLTAEETAAGWRDLASASLWSGGIFKPLPADAWKFENGCIVLESPKQGGSIFSNEEFNNFELAFDWAIAVGGNSGLKYMGVRGRRHPDVFRLELNPLATWGGACLVALLGVLFALWRKKFEAKWALWTAMVVAFLLADGVCFAAARWFSIYQEAKYYPTGLEYQMIDNDRHEDGKKPNHRTGALYDFLVPVNAEVLPPGPGNFNSSRIVVKGKHAEHWLNGRKVVDYDFGSDALKAALAASKFAKLKDMAEKSPGHLELQNHGAQVWFRNLRIRDLGQ